MLELIMYQLNELLIHAENKAEVFEILRKLDREIFIDESREDFRKPLINRLKELGEDKIVERLGK
jgi:hypothetical protein